MLEVGTAPWADRPSRVLHEDDRKIEGPACGARAAIVRDVCGYITAHVWRTREKRRVLAHVSVLLSVCFVLAPCITL